MPTKFQLGNLKKRGYLKHLGVDSRTIQNGS